jgi:hypothetical protein
MTDASYVSPPALAKRYGVKPDKVLTWIASRELEAINVAERSTGRPRWRISPEAIAAFERRRSSQPEQVKPVPRYRRRRKIPRYV